MHFGTVVVFFSLQVSKWYDLVIFTASMEVRTMATQSLHYWEVPCTWRMLIPLCFTLSLQMYGMAVADKLDKSKHRTIFQRRYFRQVCTSLVRGLVSPPYLRPVALVSCLACTRAYQSTYLALTCNLYLVALIMVSCLAYVHLLMRNSLVDKFLGLFLQSGKDQWDCDICIALFLQQSNLFLLLKYPYLFGVDLALSIAWWHCRKSMRCPKKFVLVHQTVSPCEKMRTRLPLLELLGNLLAWEQGEIYLW